MRTYSLNDIVCAAQIAVALEASAMPKPGNVDPVHDFADTRYEHYLASAAAFGPTARKAAARARRTVAKRLPLSHIRIGALIQETVAYSSRWHRGRNTILGTVTLLLPLAAGAAAASALMQPPNAVAAIRRWTREVCRSTQVDDAIVFYRTLKAVNPGGLASITPPGVPSALSSNAEAELRSMRLTLFDVMEKCRGLDTICSEWASGMRIAFTKGYPALREAYEKTVNLRTATSHCFLTILAAHEDTLIRRKAGGESARMVSEMARIALDRGGLYAPSGVKEIMNLDSYLRRSGNLLNPGTTADVTAASLMIGLLAGLRP